MSTLRTVRDNPLNECSSLSIRASVLSLDMSKARGKEIKFEFEAIVKLNLKPETVL